jgi:hypothetical protein
MVGEGCYHHKQCCGDAAWASRPEEGVGGWGGGGGERTRTISIGAVRVASAAIAVLAAVKSGSFEAFEGESLETRAR